MKSTSKHLHFKHISISFGTKRKSPFIRINTQIPPLNIFASSTYLFLLALKVGLYGVKQREEKRLVILTICIKIIGVYWKTRKKRKRIWHICLCQEKLRNTTFSFHVNEKYHWVGIAIPTYICLDEHILAFKLVKCFLPFM